jgi:hypothetical protein
MKPAEHGESIHRGIADGKELEIAGRVGAWRQLSARRLPQIRKIVGKTEGANNNAAVASKAAGNGRRPGSLLRRKEFTVEERSIRKKRE